LRRLQALLGEQQAAFMKSLEGQEIAVLLEKPGRDAGQLVGRSPWLQPVICDETVGKIGDSVTVRIERASANSLISSEAANRRRAA
jgi:tRNA-2-methylthio-N6-dimethylallyladenosine synthase